MIPKDDADISGPELRRHAVNAQDLLNNLNDRKPFTIIFLLDCCRTYHLRNPDLDTRSPNESHRNSSGLKAMHQAGSLIAFACAPGTIANDGKGQRNGLFTKCLLKHLRTPNEDIRLVLADVTSGVMEESQRQQIPFFSASLTHKRIYLCDQAQGN